MRIDVHQHLWTPPLVEALERRERPPFVRRDGPLCMIHVAGERPSAVDLESEQVARRLALLERDGVDRALIAMSSPLGIEALPRRDAQELIGAHLDGVGALGESFGAWGPLTLDGLCAADVDAVVERGCAGVSLPAGALSPPSAIEALEPVFARLEQLEVALFVHPGPGRGTAAPEFSLHDPLWWPALTRYVAQMQAAWLSFAAAGRRDHPGLRVVFAMLAGGAPLLSERLAARGGPALEIANACTFYDTSSYGPVAVGAMASVVGSQQLLYGSDRPVIEPQRDGRDPLMLENGAWLASRAVALP